MFKDRPSEVRISGTTEIYTYILHFEAAKFALEVAKEPRAGSFYHSLHCIVSTAFGLEAFLNHIGRRLFPSEPKFKWRRPDEKFQAVCTKLGFTPDMGVSPYQAFGQAFATRDLAAHSETVVRTFDRPAPPKDELPAHERSPLELGEVPSIGV